jgi:hypothetical protein
MRTKPQTTSRKKIRTRKIRASARAAASKQAKRVGKLMNRLAPAFAKLGIGAEDASEVAFHFADTYEELVVVMRVLDKVLSSEKCSPQQFECLRKIIPYHWSYHFSKLGRLLERTRIKGC